MDPTAVARARAAALMAAKGLKSSSSAPATTSPTGGRPPQNAHATSSFAVSTADNTPAIPSVPPRLSIADAESARRRKQLEDMSSTEHEQVEGQQWMKRVDINDYRNRYLVSKAETLDRLKAETGATVTARGKYYPDRLLATEQVPPLHVVVVAPTQAAVDQAVEQIHQLLQKRIVIGGEAKAAAGNTIHEEKVFPGMENTAAFPLRSKLIGPQGSYIKHIQTQTGARVQIKGHGSGYRELATGLESDEPLHVHIMDRRREAVDNAKRLIEDLLKTIRSEYEKWRLFNPHLAAATSLSYNAGPVYHPSQPPPPSTPPPPLPEGPPPPLHIASY